MGFRFDAFNALNIASYGNPDTGITDSNFGNVSNATVRSQERRLFRVHWAGTHSSTGTKDCGPKAELLLTRLDLQLLSNAVGGPGVEPRRFILF